MAMKNKEVKAAVSHPDAFHVSGPRNAASPNWKDLINSSWKDEKHKKTVIACFIQGVYLLELDRQAKRTEENALAPSWWIPFKYKLSQTIVDERDGSIFGAILGWDRSAALSDLVVMRPSGAPQAVLALRGTLLKSPTIRRDIQDDLRFFAWESLEGSVRFKAALDALKSIAERYGSSNVCIAGHSLGAGFALQVGKALAEKRIFVEAHLFNPPSVSLAMGIKNFGERAESIWNRVKSMIPSSNAADGSSDKSNTIPVSAMSFKNWIPNFNGQKGRPDAQKWVPHLYVNNSDYICCYYTDPDGGSNKPNASKGNLGLTNGEIAANLYVLSKGKQKFLEAHGLEQWWSDDVELQRALHNSKLISRQLKSLYSMPTVIPR